MTAAIDIVAVYLILTLNFKAKIYIFITCGSDAKFTIIDVRCIAKVAGKVKLYIPSMTIKTQMNLEPFCFGVVRVVLNISAYFAKVFHFLCFFF